MKEQSEKMRIFFISVPCGGKVLAAADAAAAPGAGSCGGCPGGIGGTPMGGQPGNMAGIAEIKIKFIQMMQGIFFAYVHNRSL